MIGVTGRVSGDLHSNDGCWMGGGMTADNGTYYYFYKVAVQNLGGGGPTSGSGCPAGSYTGGAPASGARVRVLTVSSQDAYYASRHSYGLEGKVGRVDAGWSKTGEPCWYAGQFYGDDGSSFYFYQAAIEVIGGSTAVANACPPGAVTYGLSEGTRVKVVGLHSDDAYHPDSARIIGTTGRVSGDLHSNDGCWMGGGFTADDGTYYYFYKAAVVDARRRRGARQRRALHGRVDPQRHAVPDRRVAPRRRLLQQPGHDRGQTVHGDRGHAEPEPGLVQRAGALHGRLRSLLLQGRHRLRVDARPGARRPHAADPPRGPLPGVGGGLSVGGPSGYTGGDGGSMTRSVALPPPLAALAALAALGCNPPVDTTGEFDLDVTIPASYAAAHSGLGFALALVEGVDGNEIDTVTGSLPSSGSTAALFADAVVQGVPYELHFWVDSNLGGGTALACDGAPDSRSLWRVAPRLLPCPCPCPCPCPASHLVATAGQDLAAPIDRRVGGRARWGGR
jgi:hypothetical protein